MSLEAYSSCSIRFIPDDKYASKRDYSDRSLVELHQDSFGDYVLRGIDIKNNKARIFDIQLTKRNIYKIGSSANVSDEVRDSNGTYRLFLNPAARDQFHEALKSCFEQLDRKPQESVGVGPGKSTAEKLSTDSMNPKTMADGNELLTNIHKLSECIENGDADGAVGFASKLASQRVQLKAKILDKKLVEELLRIRIKIDGIDLLNNGTNKLDVLNVYRSTTIHELQAMFQYTHGFPSADQYLFVNGHLAHAESTMNDLKVQDNALFILFINKTKQGDDSYF